MSRIGRQPIDLPSGVQVTLGQGLVTVQGPGGTLSEAVNSDIKVEVQDSQVLVSRPSDARQHRALHGLTRALVANMVIGVSQGYQKTLDIVGIGYRAQQAGENVILAVGFSHTVEIKPLEGAMLEVEGNNRVHVRGTSKQRVGEMAARIRAVRRPNAYTGKGIRYLDEQVKLKPGKSGARAG